MAGNNEIRRALRSLHETGVESGRTYMCRVLSINSNDTIDVEPVTGEADILGVKLSTNDGTGFKIIPKEGTIVYVNMVTETFGYVGAYGDTEQLYLGGDDLGGLVKVDDLVTKLNNLETKVNNIIATFTTHVHNLGQTPTTPPTAPPITTLTPTQATELANTKVKHGSS